MKLTLNLNNWNFYFFGLIILILCWARFCQPVKKTVQTKPDISKEVKKQDSIVYVVKWRDSIRNKLVVKWKFKTDTLHYDTTYVHEIVSICDTIIKTDSTQISNLKSLHQTDSIIIEKQSQALTKDSVQIAKLNRKVRFWRGLNKFSFLTGVASGGYLGYKLN